MHKIKDQMQDTRALCVYRTYSGIPQKLSFGEEFQLY